MPPKRAIGGTGVGRPQQPRGHARQVLNELTSPDNRSVVTSIAFFAVSRNGPIAASGILRLGRQAGVAFLHSSWSEIILPP